MKKRTMQEIADFFDCFVAKDNPKRQRAPTDNNKFNIWLYDKHNDSKSKPRINKDHWSGWSILPLDDVIIDNKEHNWQELVCPCKKMEE